MFASCLRGTPSFSSPFLCVAVLGFSLHFIGGATFLKRVLRDSLGKVGSYYSWHYYGHQKSSISMSWCLCRWLGLHWYCFRSWPSFVTLVFCIFLSELVLDSMWSFPITHCTRYSDSPSKTEYSNLVCWGHSLCLASLVIALWLPMYFCLTNRQRNWIYCVTFAWHRYLRIRMFSHFL